MTRTLAVVNQKGGVGKTTTAINLAAAFALRGRPTLLIDLDPQSNSSMSYLDVAGIRRSVYDAIVDGTCSMDEIVVESPVENLWVAPSRINLELTIERFPGLRFTETREHLAA